MKRGPTVSLSVSHRVEICNESIGMNDYGYKEGFLGLIYGPEYQSRRKGYGFDLLFRIEVLSFGAASYSAAYKP